MVSRRPEGRLLMTAGAVLLLTATACAVTDASAIAAGGGPAAGGSPGLGGASPPAGDVKVQLASNESWLVFTADPSAGPLPEEPTVAPATIQTQVTLPARALGPAQRVCLDALTPPTCAAGAVLFNPAGNLRGNWAANLDAIPGSAWIWGPSASDATTADGQEYWFTATVLVGGVPTGGTLWIAADDWAEVLVNGQLVPLPDGGSGVGSRSDGAASAMARMKLSQLDLLPFLHEGVNAIVVHAANLGSLGACAGPCTYAQNPAGVVFGGTITYAAGPSSP